MMRWFLAELYSMQIIAKINVKLVFSVLLGGWMPPVFAYFQQEKHTPIF